MFPATPHSRTSPADRTRDRVSPALEATLARFSGVVRDAAHRRGLSESEVDEVFQDVRIRLWRASLKKNTCQSFPFPP